MRVHFYFAHKFPYPGISLAVFFIVGNNFFIIGLLDCIIFIFLAAMLCFLYVAGLTHLH